MERPDPPNVLLAEELSHPQIDALDRSRTVCICAVSAIEVHGPHLPTGSDLHQAVWMADETGARFAARNPDWTVLLYPPLAIGTDELPLVGSINTPPRTVYRAVRAFGEQLARSGFRYIMLTNGHGGPRHAAGLEAACRKVSRRKGVSMFTPSIRALHRVISGQAFDRVESVMGRRLTDAERRALVTDSHAGAWETSWYLAIRPELVSPEYKALPELHPPPLLPLERLGEWMTSLLERWGRRQTADGVRELSGALSSSLGWLLNARFGYGGGERVSYHGAPALASAELGRAYAEVPVEMCLEDLEGVASGRIEALEVKSIASDHVVVQPHFPRLAAGVALGAVVLAVWAASWFVS